MAQELLEVQENRRPIDSVVADEVVVVRGEMSKTGCVCYASVLVVFVLRSLLWVAVPVVKSWHSPTVAEMARDLEDAAEAVRRLRQSPLGRLNDHHPVRCFASHHHRQR